MEKMQACKKNTKYDMIYDLGLRKVVFYDGFIVTKHSLVRPRPTFTCSLIISLDSDTSSSLHTRIILWDHIYTDGLKKHYNRTLSG